MASEWAEPAAGEPTAPPGAPNPPPPRPHAAAHARVRATAEIALMLAIVAVAAQFLFATASHAGPSMAPVMEDGDRVLVARLPYSLALPQRGDLALVREPGALGSVVVRRVIGAPGDKVSVRGRQVLVNDRVLDEPYVRADPTAQTLNFAAEYRLGDAEFLLLSDNRDSQASFNDGRSWGATPASRIIGRATAVYWPLERARLLSPATYDIGD